MARGKTQKLYRNFIKGLISEAGFLTYPENASSDELNCVIKTKGSRSRRFGIDYEPSSTASVVAGMAVTDVVAEFFWRAVNNISALNYICIQVGSTIHFYDTASEPFSGNKKTFTIDLLTYKTEDATEAEVEGALVQMASGKGFLFIAQEFINPLVVEYDLTEDDITVTPIFLQVRDYDGLDDGLANDEEPTSLSPEHFYNLRNQGWLGAGSTNVGPGGGEVDPDPPAAPGGGSYYNPWLGEYVNIDEV